MFRFRQHAVIKKHNDELTQQHHVLQTQEDAATCSFNENLSKLSEKDSLMLQRVSHRLQLASKPPSRSFVCYSSSVLQVDAYNSGIAEKFQMLFRRFEKKQL